MDGTGKMFNVGEWNVGARRENIKQAGSYRHPYPEGNKTFRNAPENVLKISLGIINANSSAYEIYRTGGKMI
jgi:hypothetical protein